MHTKKRWAAVKRVRRWEDKKGKGLTVRKRVESENESRKKEDLLKVVVRKDKSRRRKTKLRNDA